MAQREVRICPKCGTRNKGKWEFCVRCGESLEDVTIAVADAGSLPAFEEELPPSEYASPIGAILLFLVLVGVVVATPWWFRRQRPTEVTPAIFQVPPAPAYRETATPTDLSPVEKEIAEGRRLLAAGDITGALKHFQSAVDAEPQNAYCHAAFGEALLAIGQTSKALDRLARASQLDPRNAGYRQNLAAALNYSGRYDEAMREYTTVLSQQPANVDVQEDLGQLLLHRKGDPTSALPHLRVAADARPGDLIANEQLALALEQTHDLEGAANRYKDVLDKSPSAAEARGRLAEILFAQGKTDDAISLTREGIIRDSRVPILHRDLGSFLERAGRPREAGQAYREYARLSPNAEDAQAMLDRADALEKEAGGAS